ncbi:MAG: bifunctional aspartate kinase/homoserine dehydrogenase I [Cyclobacteriaceae bacterium]|nr:bifunctional aspartate kinase/homoserine dehydrogenase I [Cyclobacteriaceae bacterium]
MNVIKFGGSSVGTPERISQVIDILLQKKSESSVTVVLSAFGGVTDQLIQCSEKAWAGNQQYLEELTQLAERHYTCMRSLLPVEQQSRVIAQVKIQFNALEDILHGVFLVKERTPRSLDYIMSFGERLSAYIITEAMKQRGLDAEYLDARNVIRTDDQFGAAQVDFDVTNELIREYVNSHPKLQVVTGFIASSESGETTTLGRSGSDYTAAILAAALHAEALEIWTDVDGILTANPKQVKKAFPVPEMSYEEAMELSHFGAKVIFPATMRPAMALKIPIWIKNTFNPSAPGTCISACSTNGKLIKGISSIDSIALLNLQGSGMVGVVGVSSRLFAALAQEKINVILISQASSEHSICMAVDSKQARTAKKAIEKEFHFEINNKLIDTVDVNDAVSIIALVGDGMKHHPGTSGRMFSALGKNGVNVVAIAQGSSERNISAVIPRHDTAKALSALHDAFFLSNTRTINLYLAGTGLIGSTLLRQIQQQLPILASTNNLDIRLAGVANSTKMLLHKNGLALEKAITDMKENGQPSDLHEFVKAILHNNLPNSVFVDCTASETVAEVYDALLASNVAVVTPNKKANASPWQRYENLRNIMREHGSQFLYETNVCAGLPVINTLNDLLLSGDRVHRIEAVLSGTLNYIFSSFNGSKKFSEVVAEAKALGYTEPDPRDDLSGMDVARKMLILARETGLQLELEDVQVESLVPENCRGKLAVDEFMNKLKESDDDFEQLRLEAEKKNQKLRYQAMLNNGTIQVGLTAVGSDHPFYSLSGSDNIIQFITNRYNDRPMVIRGPGAGAEVTAAGVFADIIRIGNSIR